MIRERLIAAHHDLLLLRNTLREHIPDGHSDESWQRWGVMTISITGPAVTWKISPACSRLSAGSPLAALRYKRVEGNAPREHGIFRGVSLNVDDAFDFRSAVLANH